MAAMVALLKHLEEQEYSTAVVSPSSEHQHFPRVYLAGYEVFLPLDQQQEIIKAKKAICEENGVVGVFPSEPDINPVLPPATKARMIFSQNVHLMYTCQCIIANISPFRGVSADVGTAFELGHFVGKNKPVFAYTTTCKLYAQRVQEYRAVVKDDTDTNVEAFSKIENCMITESAYAISIPKTELEHDSLETFREVVKDVRVFYEQEMGLPPLKRARTESSL